MIVRTSTGTWLGDLKGGNGTVALGSGEFEGPYTFASRFEQESGTNPDELLGAALSSCYSMFLAGELAKAGFPATRVHSEARVHLGKDDSGPAVERIDLVCRAEVAGIDVDEFDRLAAASKAGCPISKAIAAPVELDARLT